METMKLIKIMKIIQTMEMKANTQQTNTCSKSTIEKRFWCLYGALHENKRRNNNSTET